MWIKEVFALSLGVMVWGFSNNALQAQTGTSALAGVYTAAQAGQGHTLYSAQCSACHLDDLTGSGMTPPLAGDAFMADWTGQPLANLFDKIKDTMPADHPGTLSPEQTADVLAFILSSNKFPAGKTELPTSSESLKQIQIDKPPTGGAQPEAQPQAQPEAQSQAQPKN